MMTTMIMRWGYSARTWAMAGLVIGWAALPHDAQAQGPARGDPVRVIVAPGLVLAGGTELESGIGGVGNLAVERGRHRLLLRLAVIVDVAGFPDGSGDGHVSEIGLLYGLRGRAGRGPGRSISAGLAAVHFQRCPDEPTDPFNEPGCSTLGIPVVAESGIGNSVVGIAIHLFGNLNTLAPFGGVGVSLPLGWMR